MNLDPRSRARVAVLLVFLGALTAFGCSRRDRAGLLEARSLAGSLEPKNLVDLSSAPVADGRPGSTIADPPSGLVNVAFGPASLTLWPFTAPSLDGTPSDPVNLIFVGKADPVQIRSALIALDGDRTALGFPPVPPFNARWSDAAGDVHANFAEGSGWSGSVIQLQLGPYEPLRFHLRLFQTGIPFGSDGEWTVGAAHFELMIPGTPQHQVLSWELAEQIVVADLMRSGLLDASSPLAPTGEINPSPFKEIPDFIYNGLPVDLQQLIGGPPGPVSAPVPIPTDGHATILHLAQARAPEAGTATQSFTVPFQQVIPRPFCSQGPGDWIFVTGPVDIERTSSVDDRGRYQYRARVTGRLSATPVDITQSPPVPIGEPFDALISDQQEGWTDPTDAAVSARVRQLVPGKGGSEILLTELRTSSQGPESYSASTRCRD